MNEDMQLLNSTQIPNGLVEMIISGELSEREARVALFVCRKTIGWNKETQWLSLSYIEKGTKIDKAHVSRTVQTLIEKKILEMEEIEGNRIYSLGGLLIQQRGVAERATDGLPKKQPIKHTIIKHTKSVGTPLSVKENGMYQRTSENTDDLPIRDEETGSLVEPIPSVSWKGGNTAKGLIKFAEQRRGKPFMDYAGQYRALKKLCDAKYSTDQIEDAWIELESKGKGVDFWKVVFYLDQKQ